MLGQTPAPYVGPVGGDGMRAHALRFQETAPHVLTFSDSRPRTREAKRPIAAVSHVEEAVLSRSGTTKGRGSSNGKVNAPILPLPGAREGPPQRRCLPGKDAAARFPGQQRRHVTAEDPVEVVARGRQEESPGEHIQPPPLDFGAAGRQEP